MLEIPFPEKNVIDNGTKSGRFQRQKNTAQTCSSGGGCLLALERTIFCNAYFIA
ncbi:MAG: hypothetical protein KJZ95_17700 [Caldilinea sp.]|jgi:hypothetical protein|nr:hypothetical protein [Caldilinea sp.]